jgi:Nucleotidyl transferase AbiEii toxin, Type IV TA system
MSQTPSNFAASVRARLLNLAKLQGVEFNQILVRFTLERFLHRLSLSQHADDFLLKGALLFSVWYNLPHRPTRDADFLGFCASDLDSVARVFRTIAAVEVEDGIVFDPNSVTVEEIKKEAGYGGVRVQVAGELARARCKAQIDIGFGDVVTPAHVTSTYPVLLGDLAAPQLRTYPAYTVVAEKFHAITVLGMTNSRLKDYFDLSVLFRRETLETGLLVQALFATFKRRDTAVPDILPEGLSDEFAQDVSRQTLWRAFIKKHDLPFEPLADIVVRLRMEWMRVLNSLSKS